MTCTDNCIECEEVTRDNGHWIATYSECTVGGFRADDPNDSYGMTPKTTNSTAVLYNRSELFGENVMGWATSAITVIDEDTLYSNVTLSFGNDWYYIGTNITVSEEDGFVISSTDFNNNNTVWQSSRNHQRDAELLSNHTNAKIWVYVGETQDENYCSIVRV